MKCSNKSNLKLSLPKKTGNIKKTYMTQQATPKTSNLTWENMQHVRNLGSNFACRFDRSQIAHTIQWLGYRLDDPMFDSWQGQDIFLLATTSRLVLKPTQPTLDTTNTRASFLRGESIWGMNTTTHLKLGLRSRKSYTSIPIHIHGIVLTKYQGQLYIFLLWEPSCIISQKK
jgi:hypothetical protein